MITHFDFWSHYDEAASPNDSALFITQSNDRPPDDLGKNFTSVTSVDDPPSSDFDKSWNIWSCQKFVGAEQTTGTSEPRPAPDSEALPK